MLQLWRFLLLLYEFKLADFSTANKILYKKQGHYNFLRGFATAHFKFKKNFLFPITYPYWGQSVNKKAVAQDLKTGRQQPIFISFVCFRN